MKKLFGSKKDVSLNSEAVQKEINEMIEQLGFDDGHAIRSMDPVRQMTYLENYRKTVKTSTKKAKKAMQDTPQFFITQLRDPPKKEVLSALRVRLGALPVRWLQEFITLNGVPLLLNVLDRIEINTLEGKLKQVQCLQCIKLIMNNGVGLKSVLATPESLNKIVLTLRADNAKSKIMILELLAALCLAGEEYYKLVVAALEHFREVYRERKPYVTLVDYLGENTHHSVKAASLGLINSLINCTEELPARINLRDHFKQLDLLKVLRELRKTHSNRNELIMQMNLFDKEMKYDEDKVMEKLLDGKQETDPFVLLKKVVGAIGETPLFSTFVTIFNLLGKFAMDVDMQNDESMKSFSFLEKLVKKIAMNKQGVNLGGDEELLAYVLQGSSAVSGDKNILLQQNMAEAKKKLRVKNQQLKEKDLIIAKLAQRLKNSGISASQGVGGESTVGDTDEGEDGEATHNKDGTKKLPARPGEKKAGAVDGKKTLPRLPSEIIRPEEDEFETSEETAVAVPLPTGAGGPPPPPPPPGMKAPATPQRNKVHPTKKLKGFQWTRLRTRQIANTVWVKVKYDKYSSTLPYEEIEQLFAAAVIEEKPKDTGAKKNVSVLDPRRAQNVGILLTKFKCTNEVLRDAILNMNENVLDLETMNQLIKYIPTKDEITAINTFLGEQDKKPEEERSTLGKPEEFFLTLSSIANIDERMKLMLFKLQFPDKLYSAKPDVRLAYNALNQIRKSQKMFSMMELILILGNFINDGTFRGNASGFKIDALIKMADTKSSVKPKFTLVHYLVQLTESLRPELLDFSTEIEGALKAATLSWATVTNDVHLLRAGITQLEKDIERIPKQGDDDRFQEVMESFMLVSSEELKDTEDMMEKVETEFVAILKFFAEDGNLQVEDFFAIFKRFITLFESAKTELLNERETAQRTAKRDAERKSRLAAMKEARANPNKERLVKPLIKVEDDEDLEKIINDATEHTEASDDNIGETVLDDMIAKVQDGKIKTRAVEESDEEDDDDYDEEASAAQLEETRELMKRLGIDIEAIKNVGEAES